MQRVRHWPSTHSSPEAQLALIAHSETGRQSGWQIPMSQKSAGSAQFASLVQLVWHAPLMQVKPAPQSSLKTQAGVGAGFDQHVPMEQMSPVPQSASVAQAAWHSPSSSHTPPPHSPE
jgi:hypothetical protein